MKLNNSIWNNITWETIYRLQVDFKEEHDRKNNEAAINTLFLLKMKMQEYINPVSDSCKHHTTNAVVLHS